MKPEFNLVKKGYNPVEVDEYIQELEHIIKSYKDKDNAIKNALINAEIASDNIIKNAKLNASQIKFNAEEEASALKSSTQTEHNKILSSANTALDNIVTSIAEQKKILASFQSDYDNLINKYLKNIQTDDYKRTFDKITSLEAYILNLKVKDPDTKVSDIEDSNNTQVDPNSLDNLIPFINKTDNNNKNFSTKQTSEEVKVDDSILKNDMSENTAFPQKEAVNPLDILLSKEPASNLYDDVEKDMDTEKHIGEKFSTNTKAKSDIIAELQKASSVASTIYDSKPLSKEKINNKSDAGKHNLW